MDTLPELLHDLKQKKYFAYIAVIFFAFVTALIFALLAQQTTRPSVNDLRLDIKNGTGSPASSNRIAQSPLDKLVSLISGRKSESEQRPGLNSADDTSNGSSEQPITKDTTAPSDNQNHNNQEKIAEKIAREALPLPKVQVKNYILQTELPESPSELKIYRLKTHFTDDEIENMASTLGFSTFKDEKIVIEKNKDGLVQVFDLTHELYLAVNNGTGTMFFSSEHGIPAPTQVDTSGDAQQAAQQNALAFVRSLGFTQPCLKPISSYAMKSQPNTTNIEIRCEWQTMGAPIVSYFGILNLPLDKALNNISLGEIPSYTGSPDSVRPNDFNTIIVQEDTRSGNITGFSSNIPQVLSEISVNQHQIVPPHQGFNNLQHNQKQFAFVAPQGNGFTNLENVYINGTARADSVNVTDFMLAYPVTPNVPQEYLCPEWVTRSRGRLESGYDGLFVESMKAVEDSRCGKAVVLGTNTSLGPTTLPNPKPTLVDTRSRGDSLQYKNFVFEGYAAPETGCPAQNRFTNMLEIKPGVILAWIDPNIGRTINKVSDIKLREWWIVITSEQQISALAGSSSTFSPELLKEYMRFRAKRAVKCDFGDPTDCPISSETRGSIFACKYLTTGSPSLYLVSDRQRQVHVQANSVEGVIFAYPPFTDSADSIWDITVHPYNVLTLTSDAHDSTDKTIQHDRLYWEYNKPALLENLEKWRLSNLDKAEEQGYMVKTHELIEFFEKNIATHIGLSAQQTRDLVGEVKREYASLENADYVKIVMAPQDFIETYLSLSVDPKPEKQYRYFFIISPARSGEALPAPSIQKIVPRSFYSVETGTLIITP